MRIAREEKAHEAARAWTPPPPSRLRVPVRRGLRLLILLAAGLSGPAPAAGEVDRLAQLLRQGGFEAAYAFARQYRDALEGDPRFDYLYGLAALESGDPGEAVFALRRVMSVRPELGVRFHLARAWFLLGQDLLARREFEHTLARDPPAPMRAQIERYLHALDQRASRYRTTIRGHLEIGGGHDTNVTTAIDADSILLNGTVMPLEGEARAQPDDFARVSGKLHIGHPAGPDIGLFGELEGERRYHAEWRDYETGHGQVRAGLAWHADPVQAALAARQRRLYVGGEHYRDTAGFDTSARYSFSDVQIAELGLGYARLSYAHPSNRARDADRATMVLGASRLFRIRLRPAVSLFALHGHQEPAHDFDTPSDDERSKLAKARRDLTAVGGNLRLQLAPRWILRSDLLHRRTEYPQTDPLFGRTREDEYASAELALQWYPGLHWRVQARLSRSVNESSIELHDYEREQAELAVRYTF